MTSLASITVSPPAAAADLVTVSSGCKAVMGVTKSELVTLPAAVS